MSIHYICFYREIRQIFILCPLWSYGKGHETPEFPNYEVQFYTILIYSYCILKTLDSAKGATQHT